MWRSQPCILFLRIPDLFIWPALKEVVVFRRRNKILTRMNTDRLGRNRNREVFRRVFGDKQNPSIHLACRASRNLFGLEP